MQVKSFEILLIFLILLVIALKIFSLITRRKTSSQEEGSAIALKICNTKKEQIIIWKQLTNKPEDYKLICNSACTQVKINHKLFKSSLTFHWIANLEDMITQKNITLSNKIDLSWTTATRLKKIIGENRYYLIHAGFVYKGNYIQIQPTANPKPTKEGFEATAPTIATLYGTVEQRMGETTV